MTLDELAKLVMETYAAGCDPDELDRKAARAVLLAVVDWLYHRNLSATADELRRIAGEGS